MSEEMIISVRGLKNQFGSQVVHENLDFDVRRGEVLGVIGGSGTGKSVLMRSILGLQPYVAGEVFWFGASVENMSSDERRALERRIGVLFQDGALFSSLTVLENILVPLREHTKLGLDFLTRLARLKLTLVGLKPEAGEKYPQGLSGGMRKRAGLARSLAMDPEVVFLDEPTAGLDPIGAAAFDELILTLKSAMGLTVVLITHDMDSLYRICDRVAVISNKKVLATDTIEKIAALDDPWIRDYFHGPRARAAQAQAGQNERAALRPSGAV